MKINENQRAVCNNIISQFKYWISSNDFTSPTHIIDIEEEFRVQLEEIIDEDTIDNLISKVQDIYSIIKRIK